MNFIFRILIKLVGSNCPVTKYWFYVVVIKDTTLKSNLISTISRPIHATFN